MAALAGNGGDSSIDVAREPSSVERLEWEHIQRVLVAHDGRLGDGART